MSQVVPSMQDLLEAGVHFGHKVRRGNPKMGDYIYGVRGGVHIINLEQSEKLLQAACDYAKKLGSEGRVLLFLGTKKQAHPIIEEAAAKTGAPFITARWVGGLFTNFDEIKKNIKKLEGLKEQREKGELSRYTKKEQLLISRKITKFEFELGGITGMEKIPDAVFIIDPAAEKSAVAEANKTGVKIIGIADSNCNPMLLDFPIPGNDDATKSIKILTEAIASAYAEGKGKKSVVSSQTAEEKSTKTKRSEDSNLKTEDLVEVAVPVEEIAAAEEAVEKEAVKEAERVV